MKMISQTPHAGAYPPIQEGNFPAVPEGMALWPESLSTEEFYRYNGFVTLTIQTKKKVPTVTVCVPNVDAWEAWKASLPPEPGPEPEPTAQDDTDQMLVDHELRITLLELGVTE